MRSKKRKHLFLFSLVLIPTAIVLVFYLAMYPFTYKTTDISEYGRYIGNVNNEIPHELISSFFPEEIGSQFSNIRYSYCASKGDTYAFEAYLEFTIEDSSEYAEYISQITTGKKAEVFLYDTDYLEYVFADRLHPGSSNSTFFDDNGSPYIKIHCADIRKILCSEEQQKIIFVALGVFDGGIADTRLLTQFFDQFNIDPLDYAKRVSPEYF